MEKGKVMGKEEKEGRREEYQIKATTHTCTCTCKYVHATSLPAYKIYINNTHLMRTHIGL